MFYLKKYKQYLLGLLILPWLSVPLLGKKAFKQFSLSALFMCLFVVGESYVARKKVWWWFFKKLTPRTSGEFSLIWGPFFIGTLWILKMSYGKKLRYFILNLVVHLTFVYGILKWFKKIGYASLINLEKYQLVLIFTFKQILLYLFQMGVDKAKDRGKEI